MKTLSRNRTFSIVMLTLAIAVMFVAALSYIVPNAVSCKDVGSLVNQSTQGLGNVTLWLDKIATAILPIAIILAVFVIMFNHDPRTLKQQLVAILIIFAGAVIIKVVAKNSNGDGGFAGQLVSNWSDAINGGS